MSEQNMSGENTPAPLANVRVIDAPEGDAGSPNAPADKRPDTGEAELRDQLTKQAGQLAKYEELFGSLMSLPDWENRLRPYLETGNVPSADAAGGEEALDRILSKITDDPEVKEGLREFMLLQAEISQRQSKQEAAGLAKVVGMTRLEQAVRAGVEEAGLDGRLATAPEFQKFASRFEQDNSWIKSVKRDDPKTAARLVAEAYRNEMDPDALRAAQERVSSARDMTLERRGGSSANPAGDNVPAGAVRISRARMTLDEIYKAKKAKKPIAIHD